ncbi:MAG: aspartate/glutamate racemase family protein [Elsteraceae bacterium]
MRIDPAPETKLTVKHLLLINGNTTESITAALANRARAMFSGRAKIIERSAVFGPPYIENRTDALIAGHAVLATAAAAIEEAKTPFDAAVIACFGEPGLGAMREATPFPVVGMAEAGMLTAMQVCTRFAILTPGVRWPAMLWELAGHYGVRDRCAGIRPLDMGGVQLAQDPDAALDRVVAAAEALIAESGADALVIGGAALLGVTDALRQRLSVPVIDSLAASVGMALTLADLKLGKPRSGAFAPLGPRRMAGVDPVLTRFLSGQS